MRLPIPVARREPAPARKGVDGGGREIVISLPELNDPELEQYLEETIRQTARRLIGLATRRSAKK
jgi:hypothetical protein